MLSTTQQNRWHFHLRLPEGVEIPCNVGQLGPGVDVRCENGYALLPPSVTEAGKYEYTGAELQTLPESLIEELRSPPSPPPGRGCPSPRTARNAFHLDVTQVEVVPDGIRNQSLFFYADDLKNAGVDREEALRLVAQVNEQKCVPPKGAAEVERLVRSAFRYPLRGNRTPPEVEEALAALRTRWWQTQWSGIGGKSERDILRVLLEFGKRHGQLIPVGVRMSLSWRDLAVAAGVGFGTVCRAVKRLKEKGWLRSDNAERGVEDSGAMVLLARPGGYTQGTAEKNLVLRVYPLRRAPEIGKRISPN